MVKTNEKKRVRRHLSLLRDMPRSRRERAKFGGITRDMHDKIANLLCEVFMPIFCFASTEHQADGKLGRRVAPQHSSNVPCQQTTLQVQTSSRR
jgi:hypothetical protein